MTDTWLTGEGKLQGVKIFAGVYDQRGITFSVRLAYARSSRSMVSSDIGYLRVLA